MTAESAPCNTWIKEVKRLSPTRVKVSLELPLEAVDKQKRSALQHYRNAVEIPGFRKGKAPETIVLKHYRDEIQKKTVDALLKLGVSEAIDHTELVPVTRPNISLKGSPMEEGKPFLFDIEFDVKPEFELKPYQGLKLEVPKAEVSNEALENALDGLRERYATLVPSLSTQAEKGSFVVVRMGVVAAGGEKVFAPKQYTLELGAGQLLPELDAGLMSMKVGETKEIVATFPSDYDDKLLAGKEGKFTCTLEEIKRKQVPEANDDFAAQVLEGATILSLRSQLRERMLEDQKSQIERLKKNLVVGRLLEEHPFEVPSALVEQQAASIRARLQDERERQNIKITEFTKEELNEITKRAENLVRSAFILGEIARRENIVADEDAVKAQIEGISKALKMSVSDTRARLEQNGYLDKIRDEVLTDQVLDFLLKSAVIQEATKAAG